MKTKYIVLLFIILSIQSLNKGNVLSQSCYHPFIDTVIAKVSKQSICKMDRELSGDTSTIIGGLPYTIISREWDDPGNIKASQYIFEKFQSYGYNPQYWIYSSTGTNVIAQKTGIKYPNKYIIICAHYDDLLSYGPPNDTMPGADDNASGTCGVLEIARILAAYNFDYSIIFAAWDEEEAPVILSGSRAFADTAFAHGDSIVCVLNLDMIAYDSNNDNFLRIGTNISSYHYASILHSAMSIYLPEMNPVYNYNIYSDERSFTNKGFKGILSIENSPDFNPYYHTRLETFDKLNPEFFTRMVKSAAAWMAIIEKDYVISFNHNPLLSDTDTSERIAIARISSSQGVQGIDSYTKQNRPRLYYKIDGGLFTYVNAFSINLDTLKFRIPGQLKGSKVSYYIAAQSVNNSLIGSLPAGARGLNPPGTIPPSNLFSYYVLNSQSYCSNTIPKDLPPKQIVLDSVFVTESNLLYDLNLNLTINHSNDSDLYIWMLRLGYPVNQLSTSNGGSGDNYTNTTFDDEALDSIVNGTPPFTGLFVPEQPMRLFDNNLTQGYWILRIYNNSSEITGQLVNWCLYLESYNLIGINNNNLPLAYHLSQNCPNPFNPSTKINYSVTKQSLIKIEVYDIIGRKIRTLVNDNINTGNYEINFNGSDLASGIYFYSMYVDGVLFNTKKMVLMK